MSNFKTDRFFLETSRIFFCNLDLYYFKALLIRKVISPHVYDLMESMTQIMVETNDAKTRGRCGDLLVLFLLDYPLTPKRLQEHIHLILNNLDYKILDGRKAIVETLGKIIHQFPQEVSRHILVFL